MAGGAQLGAWCPDGQPTQLLAVKQHMEEFLRAALQGTQGLYLGGLVRARLMVNDGQLH